jgi:hypothetical protein
MGWGLEKPNAVGKPGVRRPACLCTQQWKKAKIAAAVKPGWRIFASMSLSRRRQRESGMDLPAFSAIFNPRTPA